MGKGGAHFDALKTLIVAFGEARDEYHALNRLQEPEGARRRVPAKVIAPGDYDPRPARDLLCRALENLVGDFVVTATVRPNHDPALSFKLFVTLTITVRTEDDYAELTVPKNDKTVVGALGALFRARANREGVAMQIEVARP